MALQNLGMLDHWGSLFPAPDLGPNDPRTFFSPVDEVHEALKAVVRSTDQSLVLSMYGFDDEELADIVKAKLEDTDITVQLTFDSSQAHGVHESALLEREDYPAASVAIGRSEKGAIIHLKMAVIDGLDVITGSTNWSQSGETKQDNQITVTRDRAFAARCAARISAVHYNILQKAASAAGSCVAQE